MDFRKLNNIGCLRRTEVHHIRDLIVNQAYQIRSLRMQNTRFGWRLIVGLVNNEIDEVYFPPRFGTMFHENPEELSSFVDDVNRGGVHFRYLGGMQQQVEFWDTRSQLAEAAATPALQNEIVEEEEIVEIDTHELQQYLMGSEDHFLRDDIASGEELHQQPGIDEVDNKKKKKKNNKK